MKVVIAVDSFKGSLSTSEASGSIAEGILRVYKSVEITRLPLADGGEGTARAITEAREGQMQQVSVCGPLGEKVIAEYGLVRDEGLAIIELASASGLTLVPEGKRNPLYTTTYGVGELIRHAIKENNARRLIIGIGGSATNDGGAGMLQALGVELLDQNDKPIEKGACGLATLSKIRLDNMLKELSECEIKVACDVKNPLCGENGASAVYGPQKGATPQAVADMDAWLSNFARLTSTLIGADNSCIEGTGAAGGIGFALVSYLGAKLCSGIDIVNEAIGLDEYVRNADVVITGEGRLDSQSCMGKAPVGVAKVAKKYGKTTIAIAGSVSNDAREANKHGIDAIFPIVKSPCTLDYAMDKENAKANLSDTAEQIFRLIKATGGLEVRL